MRNLIALRKLHNKTQKDMADLLGISRQAYAHYEADSREPDIKTIINLADCFSVTVDVIVDRVEYKENALVHRTVGLNVDENNVVQAYRAHPEMHEAVHKLLGIEPKEDDMWLAAAPKVTPAIIDLDSDKVDIT